MTGASNTPPMARPAGRPTLGHRGFQADWPICPHLLWPDPTIMARRGICEGHLPVPGRPAPLPWSVPLPGVWRYEVVALLRSHDPWTGMEALVHKYFWNAKKDRMPDYGWITLCTASDPEGQWSEEIPLLGAGPVVLFGLVEAGQFPRSSRPSDQG